MRNVNISDELAPLRNADNKYPYELEKKLGVLHNSTAFRFPVQCTTVLEITLANHLCLPHKSAQMPVYLKAVDMNTLRSKYMLPCSNVEYKAEGYNESCR